VQIIVYYYSLMDLQAILDAPSSDSSVTHDDDDDDDVLVAAQSEDNVLSQSTVSNLSNATRDEVDKTFGTTTGRSLRQGGRGNNNNALHAIMNGASSGGIRHEFEDDKNNRGGGDDEEQFDSDIVERILMKQYSRRGLQQPLSRGGGRDIGNAIQPTYSGANSNSTSANLELERILMEADAEDYDDDNDDNDDGDDSIVHHATYDKYDNDRYVVKGRNNFTSSSLSLSSTPNRDGRSSSAAMKVNSDPYQLSSTGRSKVTSGNESMDFILQSILNEDNDDDSDDDDASIHDEENISTFLVAANERSQRRFTEASNDNTTEKQKNNHGVVPSLHSMEVDAILNSVQDDDDEEDDLDLPSYNDISSHGKEGHMQYGRGYREYKPTILAHRRQSNDSDDSNSTSDENDDDWGGSGVQQQQQQQQRSRMKKILAYEKNNISIMQYPLARKEGGENKHLTIQQVQDPIAPYNQVDHRREQRDINHDTSTDDELRLPLGEDDDDRACTLSALRLQQAENIERKLLSSSSASDATATTRTMISPLTVKRRMRPRVELMTKARTSSSVAVDLSNEQNRFLSNQASQQQQQQQQPRFGFSGGIIQMKSMISTLRTGESSSQVSNGDNATDKRYSGQQPSSSLSAVAAGDRNNGGVGPALPTALAVNSKFIAIGNQGGEILVFDLYEQLKIVLGKSQQKQPGTTVEGVGGGSGVRRSDMSSSQIASSHFGSVTSIDLSSHGDYLLAGYVTGNIILWDVIKGAMLKHIADLHTSSICSARFTMGGLGYGTGDGEKLGAVSIDAGGLVNKLTFSQGRLVVWSSSYSVETECLLDGTAGQILSMDALPPLDMTMNGGAPAALHGSTHHQKTTFDSRIVLVALSSGRSSFAVSVEPKVSVLHRWARPSTERIDPSRSDDDRLTQASSNYASTYVSSYTNASCASTYVSTSTYQSNDSVAMERQLLQSKSSVDSSPVPFLPCLSWGWALVCGGGHSVTPILARAWGCCLQFLRASTPDMEDYAPAKAVNIEDNSGTSVHWPAFGTHDEFDASAPVVALNWLGKRSLVYLTITNEFIMIDTVIMTMQERLDFSQIKLVYAEFALSRSSSSASRLRHPNSNGCCTTFMNSFRLSDNRLFILCKEEVKEITALGMRQQIASLEDGGQWLEALALALDHYESTIMSQEDNKRNSDPASLALKNYDIITRLNPSLLTDDEVWMAELLMRYLILAVDNAPDSPPPPTSKTNLRNRPNLAESHFEMLSGNEFVVWCLVIIIGSLMFVLFTYCRFSRCLLGVLYCH
jgi:hypothetical protein